MFRMKSFRLLFAAAGIAAALSAQSFAADAEAGYVDVGQLVPSSKGEFVEVNLSPGLLKFAAKIAAKQEPEAAALIANLRRVRVNVVDLDETNRKSTTEQIEAVRAKLEQQGWTPMVTVREREGGDNVTVHAMQTGDDVIQGLVVTVLSEKGEAVFVNIVGSISADQIATIAEQLDIEPLRKIKEKAHQHQEPPAEKADEA
jgi:nucleotide-binding universal stress UspA family protein